MSHVKALISGFAFLSTLSVAPGLIHADRFSTAQRAAQVRRTGAAQVRDGVRRETRGAAEVQQGRQLEYQATINRRNAAVEGKNAAIERARGNAGAAAAEQAAAWRSQNAAASEQARGRADLRQGVRQEVQGAREVRVGQANLRRSLPVRRSGRTVYVQQ